MLLLTSINSMVGQLGVSSLLGTVAGSKQTFRSCDLEGSVHLFLLRLGRVNGRKYPDKVDDRGTLSLDRNKGTRELQDVLSMSGIRL